MENNNNTLTARVIVNEIDGDMYEGDALEFLESFLYYCNDRTTWGVPRYCCPLDGDMPLEFGALTVRVSDIARETGFSDTFFYSIEETDKNYSVCVMPYVYDQEFNEIYPAIPCTLTFDVSDPHDLKRLCEYIGVTFAPSFFE